MRYTFLLVLLMGFGTMYTISSCDPTKRTTKLQPITTTPKDTVVKPVVVVEPKDTVKPPPPPPKTISWSDTIQESEFKYYVIRYEQTGDGPITSDTLKELITDPRALFQGPQKTDTSGIDIVLKPSYNVVIMMPFMTNRFTATENAELSTGSLKAVEFYEGVKMALDSLDREGIRLNITVHDTKGSLEHVESLIEGEAMQEADLIIGPVKTEILTAVAEFAKLNEIPHVSPFNSKSTITEDNPYYIQMSPTYSSHSKRIVEFVEAKAILDRTTLLMVGMEGVDSARMAMIQEDYAAAKNDESARINEYTSDGRSISISSIDGYFDRSATNIIIVPSYKEELFVYNLLRELNSKIDKVEERKSYDFIVIGMPQWQGFENVNYEYYENMNLHITTDFYVDVENDEKVTSFIQTYNTNYGIKPREYAYVGFDAMLYFGRMLNKYGDKFPFFLFDEADGGRRHTEFQFLPVMRAHGVLDAQGRVEYEPMIMRHENHYINLIEFDEYLFRPVLY